MKGRPPLVGWLHVVRDELWLSIGFLPVFCVRSGANMVSGLEALTMRRVTSGVGGEAIAWVARSTLGGVDGRAILSVRIPKVRGIHVIRGVTKGRKWRFATYRRQGCCCDKENRSRMGEFMDSDVGG